LGGRGRITFQLTWLPVPISVWQPIWFFTGELMKTRQLLFVLVGIIGLIIAFEIGRHFQTSPRSTRSSNERTVSISASPSPDTGCEVDYPVAFLRQRNHIQWASNDNRYWITFLTIEPPVPGYTPESPLVPPDDPIVVDANQPSTKYGVTSREKYYMYAIYNHDPKTDPSNPCKKATDDRDTGLNVKR